MTPQERLEAARSDLRALERELVGVLAKNKTRARAPVVRLLHETRAMLNPARPYASQAGQDQIVDRLLGGMQGGTFVDVGAYDGITGSNSLYFEKWRGWTGVMVEPVETHRLTAQTLRASPCLPYAVADKPGEAAFLNVKTGYTQMSGLVGAYDADVLQQVRQNPHHQEEEIIVQTKMLSEILEEAELPSPDFVSLDIEGGELAVLRQFPFEKHHVKVWSIENNTAGPEIAEIMRQNQYKLVEFCGPDEIYAHASIDSKSP